MKYRIQKIITYLLTIVMIFSQLLTSNLGSITSRAATTRMANVVIFVDFQDTNHSAHISSSNVGDCFTEDYQDTLDLFNGSDTVNTGMAEYLNNISYGQFEQVNIFPQYNSETGKIVPFIASQNASAYVDINASVLLQEMLVQLENSNYLDGIDADLNDDGVIDNVTLVVAYTAKDSEGNDIFTSHKSSYGGSDTVNGLRTVSYNLVTESGAYLGLQESGLLIHEFLHSLGYPDLYKVGASTESAIPVGLWDIMAKNTYRIQYPLAYLRSHYTNWFTIPTVTEDVTGYTIYSASAATDTTKNNQALILKTDYSDTEFFVVEYRQQGAYTHEHMDYDSYLYGSGLIIYRVNTKQEKNIAGQTDLIYVFRPGDSYDSNGNEAGLGDLTKSYLSVESGRTSYGSSDYEATLSDGAITYSDGTNSGIVISNVGSASGDTISFDVTFGDGGESLGGFWTTEATMSLSGLTDIDSCMDAQGNMYVVAGLSESTATGTIGSFNVYKYDNTGNWTQLGSTVSVNGGHHKLVMAGDSLYVACVDYGNFRVNLYEYNNGWTRVHRSDNEAQEFDIVADGENVYMAYTAPSYGGLSYVYCEGYSQGRIVSLGAADSGSYMCNPILTTCDGQPVVITRDYMSDNRISVSKYLEDTGSWSVFSDDLYAENVSAQVSGSTLYLMKNGDGDGNWEDSYVYSLDLTNSNATWTKLGTNAFIDNSAVPMNMFFDGNNIYITYQNGDTNLLDVYVKTLVNNKWKAVGTKVTRDGIVGMNGFVYDKTIYLVYGNNTSGITIKSHAYAEDADQVGGDTGNTGNTGDSGDAGDTGNTGDSGDAGNTGNTGGTGNTGDSGDAGNTGTTGDSGDAGNTVPFVAPDINVSYRTHVQTFGWEGVEGDISTWKSNGTMSGTSGLARRLEGINIVVNPASSSEDLDLGIQYTTHCQTYGWLPWSADGDMNGTEGESKRLEAIKIQLTGEHAEYYDVYYRVHAQTFGWLNWTSNGAPAGTAGLGRRLEGIQIVVVKKGQDFDRNMGGITSIRSEAYAAQEGISPVYNAAATSALNPYIPGENTPNVAYRTHVQSFGWQGYRYNGQMSGTSGLGRRLEGINIKLTNKDYEGGIIYTTHVQSYGWLGKLDDKSTWQANGAMSGTSGQSKRLEAICIDLTGEMAEHYDIYYRVHAQTFGWLNWASNGEPAGTAGLGRRLEGIQIILVKKGETPPASLDGIIFRDTRAYIQN